MIFGNSARAQAAMEFLMTYGWAILVVLVVIMALAYFGVLSPSNLLPEKCTFSAEVYCLDFTVGASDVTVVLSDATNKPMLIESVSAASQALGDGDIGQGCGTEVEGYPVSLKPGESAAFVMDIPPEGSTCDYADTGRDINRYNLTLLYSWQDSLGILHEISGEAFARKK
ncbi:hypothetical protein HYV85_06075 [Candidatus Woesearchaeota archaeon]|nr:hypothetical protein [Candidatus Woesearchaeota archaeon]